VPLHGAFQFFPACSRLHIGVDIESIQLEKVTVWLARWRFQKGYKVIQTENNYDKDVFNGDIGIVEKVDPVEQEVSIRFDTRLVKYDYGELDEVSLAYAVSIHKSQGSEFPAVVIPLAMQHYMLLQRNLIYTGITRGKRLLVLVGQRKALGIAVRTDRPQRRYSGLLASLRSGGVTSNTLT
jgi:exodeoxyribonuclease V alpha subunit